VAAFVNPLATVTSKRNPAALPDMPEAVFGCNPPLTRAADWKILPRNIAQFRRGATLFIE
jgi:hypothetical protein